jgi:hypothetical protein
MALEVLGSFGIFDKFQEIADLRREELAHFVRSSQERTLEAGSPDSGRLLRWRRPMVLGDTAGTMTMGGTP